MEILPARAIAPKPLGIFFVPSTMMTRSRAAA
jgi:hypothetical protein